MNKLEFKIIWIDQSEADFIELQINIGNERLNTIFSCYTSLEELKKQWQKALITQVLTNKTQKWDMQGSSTDSVSFLVEKNQPTGQIALISKIIFEKNKEEQPIEECIIRIVLEPAQLDSFCEQIQQMKAKIDETAHIE